MSYRRKSRDAETVQQWRKWQKQHSDLMIATGLPAPVFEPENWNAILEIGFLMEGEAYFQKMTPRQKAALLRLIMTRSIDLNSYVGHLLVLALLEALDDAWKENNIRNE